MVFGAISSFARSFCHSEHALRPSARRSELSESAGLQALIKEKASNRGGFNRALGLLERGLEFVEGRFGAAPYKNYPWLILWIGTGQIKFKPTKK